VAATTAAAAAAATVAAAVVAAAVAAVAAARAAESACRRRALRGHRRGNRERHHQHGLAPCGGRGGPARAALTTETTAAEATRGISRRARRPVTPGKRRWGPPAFHTSVAKVCRKQKTCPAGEKNPSCLLHYALHHVIQCTGQAVRLGRDKCPRSGQLAGARSPALSAFQPKHQKWQPCRRQAGGR